MIKSYYAAFFSAHTLLRVQGISCSYFDISEIIALRRTATLYGMPNANLISGGQYKCVLDTASRTLVMVPNSKLNSHEFVWKVFGDEIAHMTTKVHAGFLTKAYIAKMDAFFEVLSEALSDKGRLNGNWLSHVRNGVNYRQEYGVWFPHGTKHLASEWHNKLHLSLSGKVESMPSSSSDIVRAFLETCIALTAACRGTLSDMAGRCPNGKSYLLYGPSAVRSLLEGPRALV